MIDLLNKYDILVFEGFEMTGKSTLLSELASKSNKEVMRYRPDWEGCLSDKVLKRGNRCIPGISVIDFLNQGNINGKILLLDRWIASSYAYKNYYSQYSDYNDYEDLAKSASLCSSNLKIAFIHKCHRNKQEARTMFDISNSDNNHEDTYDRFKSFDDYWNTYLKFESLFDEFYKSINIKVFYVTSYTNEVLVERN